MLEPPPQLLRRRRVAQGDGHVLPSGLVDLVPPPAHERDGVAVARVVYVVDHALEHRVRHSVSHPVGSFIFHVSELQTELEDLTAHNRKIKLF